MQNTSQARNAAKLTRQQKMAPQKISMVADDRKKVLTDPTFIRALKNNWNKKYYLHERLRCCLEIWPHLSCWKVSVGEHVGDSCQTRLD